VKAGAPALLRWMDAHTSRLYISVITVAEIESGIAKARREGATRKAASLAEWLEAMVMLYDERILPLDRPVARLAGMLSDRARGAGRAPGLADIAIAATAKARGMTVLTRNVRHFAALDVPVVDPFRALPS